MDVSRFSISPMRQFLMHPFSQASRFWGGRSMHPKTMRLRFRCGIMPNLCNTSGPTSICESHESHVGLPVLQTSPPCGFGVRDLSLEDEAAESLAGRGATENIAASGGGRALWGSRAPESSRLHCES